MPEHEAIADRAGELKRLLHDVDRAMALEGVPEHARFRVIQRLLHGHGSIGPPARAVFACDEAAITVDPLGSPFVPYHYVAEHAASEEAGAAFGLIHGVYKRFGAHRIAGWTIEAAHTPVRVPDAPHELWETKLRVAAELADERHQPMRRPHA